MLSCRNEAEIRSLADTLAAAKVSHILIQEVDPPYTGQATAIGLAPVEDRTELRKILSKYPLLKHKAGGDSLSPGLNPSPPPFSGGEAPAKE